MLTAILAYSQIEKVINIIWDSHERRKWYQNAYILLNTIILGPFIIVFLFSLVPYLKYENLLGYAYIPFFQTIVSHLVSFIFLLGFLFVVYAYLCCLVNKEVDVD